MPRDLATTEPDAAAPSAVDVSVCIATYRRPEGLARLLQSLARLKLPVGMRLDVWVVDNDPDGQAHAAWQTSDAGAGLDLHWLHEPRRNIALARNAALDHARGRWIAFVDDDEVVREDWLQALWDLLHAEGCDGAFGPVLRRLTDEAGRRAHWLDVETFYAQRPLPSGARVDRHRTRTSNAILRRSCLGGLRFDPALGRSGGEDVELFGRILASGADLRWCAEAVVEESLPPERHRLGWLVRRSFRGGCTAAWIERREEPGWRTAWRASRALLGLAGYATATLLALTAGRRAAARLLLGACVQAGRLYCYAGGLYEEYRG